jgi:hypothetical protein
MPIQDALDSLLQIQDSNPRDDDLKLVYGQQYLVVKSSYTLHQSQILILEKMQCT